MKSTDDLKKKKTSGQLDIKCDEKMKLRITSKRKQTERTFLSHRTTV